MFIFYVRKHYVFSPFLKIQIGTVFPSTYIMGCELNSALPHILSGYIIKKIKRKQKKCEIQATAVTGRIACWCAVFLERNVYMLSLVSSKSCLHVSVELTAAVCCYLSLIICQSRCDKGTTRLLRRTWAAETQLHFSLGLRRIRWLQHLKCHRFTAVVVVKKIIKNPVNNNNKKRTDPHLHSIQLNSHFNPTGLKTLNISGE